MKCRLREIFKERGIKQTWLAEKVGVHRSHIGKIMSEDRGVTLEIAYRIANALGLSVYDIWEL